MSEKPTAAVSPLWRLSANHPVGSAWRKWDLHVHTPASIVHSFPGADPWDRFLEDLASLPEELSVVGINDYLFIDGYRRVLQEHRAGRLPNIETIFPVLEFRLDQFVGSSQLARINFHVIFDPTVDADEIEAQFINGLSASYKLDQDVSGVWWSGFPNRSNLAALGGAIRAAAPESKRGDYHEPDLELGFNNLNVSLNDLRRSPPRFSLSKKRTLTAIGKAEWSGMKWTGQSIATKRDVSTVLMRYLLPQRAPLHITLRLTVSKRPK